MTEVRGLCLASTATRKGDFPLWLHRPTHHGSVAAPPGYPTSSPSLSSMPGKERYRPRTFYLTAGSLSERHTFSRATFRWLEKNPVGEPSLSTEAECLSLHAHCSTNVQERQGACAARDNSSPTSKDGGLLAPVC